MERSLKVAVVRSRNRRAAVAEALALIAEDLPTVVTPVTMVKPNLVSHRYQPASTHLDTLSATLDAVLHAGARQIIVAEGATDASRGFQSFGYRDAAWGRPVTFFDLNRDESEWVPLELMGTDGARRTARLSKSVHDAGCRVSLALAKTHVNTILTLSLKNMLSSLHPDDRVMMHGHAPGGNGYIGWKRVLVDFLKGDNSTVRLVTRLQGRVRKLANLLSGRNREDAWRRFGSADESYLRSVAALHHNLVALNRVVRPSLSVVDGFVGMEREGPKHGSAVRLGAVIAGTDPVAVDAVSAAVMGFDPRQIGFLALASESGLGTADLERIEILGDPIHRVRRRFVPHSNYAVQRHWTRVHLPTANRIPTPHGRPGAIEQTSTPLGTRHDE